MVIRSWLESLYNESLSRSDRQIAEGAGGLAGGLTDKSLSVK
jgi:hypothetical protein